MRNRIIKILFVIDNFGSGGAQRQLVNLAIGLTGRGHYVEFFNYYPEYNFFRHEVEGARIKIYDFYKKGKGFSLGVIKTIKKLLTENRYDVALAFLDTPSIYLSIAGIGKKTKLIVSDRNSYMNKNAFKLALKRQVYRMADAVIANSYSQHKWLVNCARLSSDKVFTIYNGYDSSRFPFSPLLPALKNNLMLLCIGRITYQKNIETLIHALNIFHKRNGWCPSVTWVGRSDPPEYKTKISALLDSNPEVKKFWTWAGQRTDIPQLLGSHHALILPSLYEGLPNVVCEALFCGKLILASNICDNANLVPDRERGFLFNPKDPNEIVSAIEKLVGLNCVDWHRISRNAYNYAHQNLSISKMVNRYERIFNHCLYGSAKISNHF